MPITSRFAAAAARAYGMFRVAASAAVDPFFNYVTALLHGDGTNGAQNNTFLDSSTNNFTITRNGNTTQGSFSPFSQTGWGNYFNGSSQYLNGPTNNAAATFTGDFTIEAWFYFDSIAADCTIAACIEAGSPELGWSFRWRQATPGFRFFSTTVGTFDFSYTPPIGSWNHVAVSRSGTSIRCFVNGTQIGTTQTASGTVTRSTTNPLTVGGGPYASVSTNGYLSNVRIVNGTAVYTANFTPPTTPLTAIANTSLLTCQSNRFVDNSSNAFALTVTGSPSVQPFSPFNPTSAWSASSNGGSGYFDGSGDYLQVANSNDFDTNSTFTLECWYYQPASGNATFFSRGGGTSDWNTSTGHQFLFFIDTGTLYWMWNNSGTNTQISTTAPSPNQWHHIAVGYNGTTTRFWLNGASVGSSATGYTLPTTRNIIRAGLNPSNQNPLTGYLSGLRFVKGTDVYGVSNTSITVPTAPLTAITNTALLLNYTNGGIYDNAAVADYETVGNAQVSTAVVKYGTGSMSFDGTGDYLVTYPPSVQQFAFGTGDFTIEFWAYFNSTSGDGIIYDSRGPEGIYPTIYRSTTSIIFYTNSAAQITASSAVTTNIWYHIALCRVAGQTKLFINGTQVGSTYADTNSYLNATNRPMIGAAGVTGYVGTVGLNGYIDDLRVTKGVGRYQYNFTPPTAAFPNIGGTVTLTADPYYNYTTLLLPGNGTNGAQNNTFLDSSTNNFTITRNGNTTQGTFTPFSQTGWGNYYDGSGDYTSFGNNANTNPAGSDFTVEGWIYPLAYNSYGPVFSNDINGGFHFGKIASGFGIRHYGTGDVVYTATTPPLNQWMHVAATRSGTSWYLFYNGTIVATATASNSFTQGTASVGGNPSTSTEAWNGYLSNVRFIKGTALWTSNFTPPTTPLTAVSGTQLLTCQSNRFVDNSSNAYAVTVGGTPSVQAFSPFAPTASYSASTVGGSGYFDGSGDYLTSSIGSIASGASFTFEFWAYYTGSLTANTRYFDLNSFAFAAQNLVYRVSGVSTGSGAVQVSMNGSQSASSTNVVNTNSWQHHAISYNGTTLSIWVNGTRVISYTPTAGGLLTSIAIGSSAAAAEYFTGYISGFRLVIGSTVYTPSNTTITVPTSPPTAISGTSLLTNFTNGGITDATAKNDLETVGNAQISTTQSKFGGSSMAFDGTGDWLRTPTSPNLDMGTGDLTIEGWFYLTATVAVDYRMIVSDATNGNNYVAIRSGGTGGQLEINVNGTSFRLNLNNSVTINTWFHLAVTRYNGTWYGFVNGASLGSNASAAAFNLGNGGMFVGRFGGATAYEWPGYMDDLRITKGIARYTSNFTPPTSAFLTL